MFFFFFCELHFWMHVICFFIVITLLILPKTCVYHILDVKANANKRSRHQTFLDRVRVTRELHLPKCLCDFASIKILSYVLIFWIARCCKTFRSTCTDSLQFVKSVAQPLLCKRPLSRCFCYIWRSLYIDQ